MNILHYLQGKYELKGLAEADPTHPIEIPATRETGLIELLRDFGCKKGAEVGVEQGKFSEQLCLGIPGLELVGVDPWEEYVDYGEAREDIQMRHFHQQAVERLAPYKVKLIQAMSHVAVNQVRPHSLDFVYIDGNHTFEYVVADIAAWSKVVKPGGIIAGHDYFNVKAKHRGYMHVKQAVNGYAYAYLIHPWFVWRADSAASWMWVNP